MFAAKNNNIIWLFQIQCEVALCSTLAIGYSPVDTWYRYNLPEGRKRFA